MPYLEKVFVLAASLARKNRAYQIMSRLEESREALEKALKDIELWSRIVSCQCEYHRIEWLRGPIAQPTDCNGKSSGINNESSDIEEENSDINDDGVNVIDIAREDNEAGPNRQTLTWLDNFVGQHGEEICSQTYCEMTIIS